MENILNNIIRKNFHGYLLQAIYDLNGEPIGIDRMKKFLRIPNNISAFLDKTKIKGVYKYDIKEVKHQYFVNFIDNTWKELEF